MPDFRAPLGYAADRGRALRIMREAGLVGIERPDRVLAIGRTALRRRGAGVVSGIAAIRHGDRPGVIDEEGELTFAELDRRSSALANAWRAQGVSDGDGVAILCRNGRGFLDASGATMKLGARAIYLNTSFAPPQVADVAGREGTRLLVHDDEFASMVELVTEVPRYRTAALEDSGDDAPVVDDVIAATDDSDPPRPSTEPGIVILTSGTTGTPKGAPRNAGGRNGILTLAAMLDNFKLRSGQVSVVPAPWFHSWGLAHSTLAQALGCTLVSRRRFDPEQTVADIASYRATTVMLVPVMLSRILELGDEVLDRYDTSSLRTIGLGGSAIPGDLAIRGMDRFGDIVVNLYGSTEVSVATIAGPADLRAAPSTAGRPVLGTTVRLFDDTGRTIDAPNVTGRIFVRGEMSFDGYTDGRHKEIIDGMMSSGDVGHFDAAGRLYVDGRDDEMIVSGAENVFPREVEDLIESHPGVIEAACLGVPDDEFGQRLRAFVVVAEDGPDEEELRGLIKTSLAGYKVPRDFVFLDALPRNPTGKILKRELARD